MFCAGFDSIVPISSDLSTYLPLDA